jgi:hypothetical protein
MGGAIGACSPDDLQEYKDINTVLHQWDLTIERTPGDPIGADLDFADGTLAQITSVDPEGVIGSANKIEGVEDLRVVRGDFLIAVNKERDTERMLHEIQNSETLVLTVNRPSKFTADLRKASGKPVEIGSEEIVTEDKEKYEQECKASRLSWPFMKDGVTQRDILCGKQGTVKECDTGDRTVQMTFENDGTFGDDDSETITKWVPIRGLKGYEHWNETSIGLGLHYVKNGCSLMIVEICDGPVKDWNMQNPKKEIKLRDRIMKVNSVKTGPEAMLKEISDQWGLKLIIVRPSAVVEAAGDEEEDGVVTADLGIVKPGGGCSVLC